MKNINYLFVLCLFACFISCGDDEEPTPIELSVTGVPTITIDENPSNGEVLATLEGKVNRGELVFSLSDQNPAGAMAIDAATGKLTVADASKFDFEANETLTATGNVEVEGVTESATITVKLTNVAETITAPNASFSIAENPENGAVIGTLQATTDAGEIDYGFRAGILIPVGIALSTEGVLTVTDSTRFDFEQRPSFTFDYEATNGADTKNGTVTVNVTDVDETVTAPNFTFTIAENPQSGVLIGTLVATGLGDITYRESDKLPNAVSLSSDGQVTVAVASLFDYEVRQTIDFEYEATNGFDTNTGTVLINITDVDERPVQVRLDAGERPSQIVASGVTVDSLYGKNYGGGIIGSYTNGNVLVVATAIVAQNRIQSSGRTAANDYVANGFADWRLPSLDEAQSICSGIRNDIRSLYPNSPNGNLFWTSTRCGGSCYQAFSFGTGSCGYGGIPASSNGDVVAVRTSN